MTPAAPDDAGKHRAARTEQRWAIAATALLVTFVLLAAFSGIHQAAMPQAAVETADPRTLHIAGEFIESNLGSALEPDGSVVVRAIGQQYSFTPQCILVPADTKITFRATSADVVHGFLIEGTNVNLMLVPGYISTLPTRFTALGDRRMPCHEFCGTGHEGMWGLVRVIDRADFLRLAADRRRVSCVE